jgi:hypothetical protein
MKRAEEKRRREREEEEKKRNNEDAFKKWLQLKEEQRLSEQKRKHKVEGDKKGSSNEISVSIKISSIFSFLPLDLVS